MGSSSTIRMLFAGDDEAVLEGLCRERALPTTVEVVGHARSAIEARTLAEELAPDVVLLDLEARALGGPSTIGEVKNHPGSPIVLVLAAEDTPAARTESFAAGADGFVTKSEPRKK